MRADSKDLLCCDSLGRDINGRAILRDVSFALPEGSVLALLGPNGAGKTTLLRVCLGVLQASRGQVTLWGLDPWQHGPEVRLRAGVATENCAFYPSLTVLENLVLWGGLFGMGTGQARAAARRELESFKLDDMAKDPAGSLSAGQRKRAGLARAFLTDPNLLVLDEPTAGLDFESRRTLRQRLLGHNGARRTTAVIASHEVGEVEKLATHLLLLKKGEVIGFGTAADVLRGRSMDTLIEESFFGEG